MSTQQVLQIGGAIIGSFIPGVGPQLGFMAGSLLAGFVPQEGPDPGDLSAPKINGGSPMMRGYGWFPAAASPIWISDFRANESGGKGGEPQSLSYSVDVLYFLTDKTDVQALLRVWVNKKLEYSTLATSDPESLLASLTTTAWESIELRDGNPAQVPWAMQENVLGVGNCPSQRGYTTLAIRGLNCGGSKSLPLVETDLTTSATQAALTAKTVLQSYFAGDDASDVSYYANGLPTITGSAPVAGEAMQIGFGPSYGQAVWTDTDLAVVAGGDLLIEFFITPGGGTTGSQWPYVRYSNNIAESFDFGVYEHTAGDANAYFAYTAGGTVYGNASTGPVLSGRTHVAMQWQGGAFALFIGGIEVFSTTASPASTPGSSATVRLGAYSGAAVAGVASLDEFRVRKELVYTADFTPPAHIDPPDGVATTWTPTQVTLSSIIDAELGKNEAINLADWDTSPCDAVMVDGYRCSGSAADAIAKICDVYYVDLVPGNPMSFVPRGEAVVATLTNEEIGVDVNEPGELFTGLREDNDDEQPAIAGLQFPNRLENHWPGYVRADRLQPESSSSNSLSTLVSLTPAEAQGRAVAYNLLRQSARYTAPIAWSDSHAALQPGDAILVPDEQGNLYELLIRSDTYADGVHKGKNELNDVSALVFTGVADATDRNAVTVVPPAVAEFLALDIPLLRDADNSPHYLGLVKTPDATGAGWHESPDNVTFTGVATYANDAVFGTVTAASGSFAQGVLFDEGSSLTVNVGDGTLSSATRDALLANRELNAFAVGSAGRMVLGQFRTATLISAGVYTLTGLLNMGAKGTEQYCSQIVAADDFAMLGIAGTAVIPRSTAAIGVGHYVKGVAAGALVSGVAGEAFTCNAVNMIPLSPVMLRIDRDSSTGDILIRWTRRTRFGTRFGGDLGDACPLGEGSEQYRVRLYTDGTYTTLLRDFGTLTVAECAYTAAQRGADGLSLYDPLYLDVRQISDVVGLGYPLQDAA